MMDLTSYIGLLIGGSIIVAGGGDIYLSKFYEDSIYQEYNCSVSFQDPMFFDCACVTGLWILYESCSENVKIAGDDTARCTKLVEAPVSKAVQVVRNREELAVVESSGKVTLLDPETVKTFGLLKSDWTMVTGSNWTLIDTFGRRICVSITEPDAYCFFTLLGNLQLEVKGVEKHCDQQFDYFIEPQRCEPLIGKSENICESRVRTSKHSLVKRQTDDDSSSDPVPINNEDDEDYHIANETSNDPDLTTFIADELMIFMNTILDEILGFREISPPKNIPVTFNVDLKKDIANSTDPNPLGTIHTNPPYEFLEIAKRITQKTCPSSYVKHNFLDVAVATFIQIQKVQFKFPETSFKPAGFRRVLQYLRKCEQHATKFTFIDANCDGTVDGKFTAFGQSIELTVPSDFADLNRDPIIETVWKIFYNVHSYCFPFFEKALDHHRFTTWMIPLFQNQINDIWTAGKTTETFFNGLFGNQIKAQENLAYCTVSSRLESSYPFDLPRPPRVDEYGPSLLGDGDVATATERRKRDLEYTNFLRPARFGNCLNTFKPLLCPDHVKSIVNRQ